MQVYTSSSKYENRNSAFRAEPFGRLRAGSVEA